LDNQFTDFVQSGQLFLNVFYCSWLEEFIVQGMMATQNDFVSKRFSLFMAWGIYCARDDGQTKRFCF
jgi:hypothetical protein